MIAKQRSLIEDLAHSNQEYIHKFEKLKLGIEGTPVEHRDDASDIRAVGRATPKMSLPGAPTGKLERMNLAVGGTSLQDKENTRSLGPRDLIAVARSSPKAQSSMSRSLATPPNANTNNVLINTSVHTNTALPPVQERGIPTTEAPMGFDQEVLFKQLKHYSMLIKNLLKEVDEAQYEITFQSRLRVKGGIAGLHEGERQELEKMWGCTALQSAEQRFESLEEGLGELSRNNRFASKRTEMVFGLGGTGRRESPSMTANLGPDSKEQEEAVAWLPPFQAPMIQEFQSQRDVQMGMPQVVVQQSKMPVLVDEAAAKESGMIIDVSAQNPPQQQLSASRQEAIKEAISKARAANMQKSHASNSNQAPAAPTTSHAPFSFGGHSLQGVPHIHGPTKIELTQDKLALPATRKRKLTSAASPLTLSKTRTPAAANKLSPFGKTESPDAQRTPVMREHIRSIWRQGTNSVVPDQLASGAEQHLTSIPASLVTPQYSFARYKADDQGSASMMPVMTSATPDQLAPQQQDTAMSGFNGLDGGVDVRASNT